MGIRSRPDVGSERDLGGWSSWRPRRYLVVLACVLLSLIMGTGCASQVDRVESAETEDGEAVEHRYSANLERLPPAYRRITEQAVADRPLDSVTGPTMARVFTTSVGDVLLIEGSGDALESFLPLGLMEDAVLAGTPAQVGQQSGMTFVSFLKRGVSQPARIAIARGKLSDQVLRAASMVYRGEAGSAKAEGDLSPYSDAAIGSSVNYVNAQGEVISVRTFPGYGVDPILEYLRPIAQPVTVDGRPGYFFDSGNGNVVLATSASASDQTLVVVAATSRTVSRSVLTRIAADLRGEG